MVGATGTHAATHPHLLLIRPLEARCTPWALASRRQWSRATASSRSQQDAVSSVEQLKGELLQAVTRANNPDPSQLQAQLDADVETAAERLCAASEAAAPAALLSGSWRLVFTSKSPRLAAAAFGTAQQQQQKSSSAASLQQGLQAASAGAYRFFYSRFPLLAGSAVGARGRSSKATNQQVVDLAAGRVDNVVSFQLGGSKGELRVGGTAEALPPAATRLPCLRVVFTDAELRLMPGPTLRLSLEWLRPEGLLETLYLDSAMRISVGNRGSFFVVLRE